MQDMGAAGITCSTSEMSAKETWHGNLVFTKYQHVRGRNASLRNTFRIAGTHAGSGEKGREEEVKRIFDKWDLNCEQ